MIGRKPAAPRASHNAALVAHGRAVARPVREARPVCTFLAFALALTAGMGAALYASGVNLAPSYALTLQGHVIDYGLSSDDCRAIAPHYRGAACVLDVR